MAEDPSKVLNPGIYGLYYATNAALNFSLQNKLAQGNLAKANTNQNFDFARGNVVRQAPQRFQANQNAANSAGLAESGILAQTQQRQAANLGQQLTGLSQQRAQAVQRITSGEQSATEGARVGKEQNWARAKKEQEDYNIANYVAPTTASTPGVAPAYPTAPLPPGYTARTQPGGSVSISPPPGTLRKKAVKKAVG